MTKKAPPGYDEQFIIIPKINKHSLIKFYLYHPIISNPVSCHPERYKKSNPKCQQGQLKMHLANM